MNSVMDDRVLFFVKYPEPGRVKTRLAEELGEQKTCEIYKTFVEDLLLMLDKLDRQVDIHFDPPDAENSFGHWLGSYRTFVPQSGANLGRRMVNALIHAFAEGCGRAVIIGSDSPDLPGDSIEAAFAALDENDAVIGPSSDGGYYLIGFTKEGFLGAVFDDIRWSGEDVFERTVEILARHSRRCHVLGQWYDVDTSEDLKELVSRSFDTDFEDSQTISLLKNLDMK